MGSERELSASGVRFAFRGNYRTQHRRRTLPSALAGDWTNLPGCLTSERVNEVLGRSALWSGRRRVKLQIADVYERTGEFTQADALYYSDYFEADAGTEGMSVDVLDVAKLENHAVERAPFLSDLFEEECSDVLLRQARCRRSAINEYFCHEGGHRLGVAVEDKVAAGHFAEAGAPDHEAISVEEFRADMHSFGVALDALSVEPSANVFRYHLAHRFGIAAFASRTGTAGAGLVPYLLYAALRELRLIDVVWTGYRPRLHVALSDAACAEAMQVCARHAEVAITRREAKGERVARRYVNERTKNARLWHEYRTLFAGN
jgi:uncharacterized protein YlaI